MKIKRVHLRNFRRLEDIKIGFENEETVLVGPNNSGKTSATIVFRLFLNSHNFKIHDFSVLKIADIDAFGVMDNADEDSLPSNVLSNYTWSQSEIKVEYTHSLGIIADTNAIWSEMKAGNPDFSDFHSVRNFEAGDNLFRARISGEWVNSGEISIENTTAAHR